MARHIECGINTDPRNPLGSPSVADLGDLGATWVRFTFKDYVDAAQPSAFGSYDALIETLWKAGINILLILAYETYPGKPAFTAEDMTWDAYIARFAARCGQIAKHYGTKVQAYQIWNEPDLIESSPVYDPCMRAGVFGRMLKAAYTAIRAVSTANVLTAGLASGQPAYLQATMASTDKLYADAVAVHPYGRRPTADWPRKDWGFGVLGDLLRDYIAVATKPVWVSEMGTNDVSVQADFPRKMFQALDAELPGQVPVVFWYCWSDGMGVPFGLREMNGSKKPCYDSYRAFAKLEFENPAVGIVSEELSVALLKAADEAQAIQFNPHAALQKRIFADGLVPNSNEFLVDSNGKHYVGQRAEHLGTGNVCVYYAGYGDWAHVERISLPLKRAPVIDDPAVHWSERQGQSIHYIIVHSTASPQGSVPKNTLDFLRGPNDRGVSVHELAMPGGKVYRMVPDERAAHHARSKSVQFPDGTPWEDANRISWGLEAFQMDGESVPEDVQAITVERIAAACRRLKLDTTKVLAHREIDPTRRDDPVGVEMQPFREKVAQTMLEDTLSEHPEVQNPLVQLNPGAALQKQLFADGYVPNSHEIEVLIGTVKYAAQRAEHLVTGKVRVYYAKQGDWGNVRFVEKV